MSAYHSRIAEEFRQRGGTLTGPQIAATVGFGWRRDLHEMRKAGYLLVEDPADLWHLDLDELPSSDVGRAADADAVGVVCERVSGSPDIGDDDQELTLPVEDEPRPPANPYDPMEVG